MFSRGMQGVRSNGGTWMRQVEHVVLRVLSLSFSLGSAHAIRWFFSPLDASDWFQPAITWIIAISFGVLGYFVSRGLAHRMMNREPVWAYAPICLVVEFVEIFCNFALAASVIQHASWLAAVPISWHSGLVVMTYVALSVVPLVSVLLAVVDMDLERKRNGQGFAAAPLKGGGNPYAGPAPYNQGYTGTAPAQGHTWAAPPSRKGGQQNNAGPLSGVAGIP
jgi:hypothetical protein